MNAHSCIVGRHRFTARLEGLTYCSHAIVTTSNPKSNRPAKPSSAVAIDPLRPATAAKPRKTSARSSRKIVVAAAAVGIAIAAAAAWSLLHGGQSAPAAAAKAQLTRDPDPPIVPPPTREPLRPAADELPPPADNLAASLAIVARATAGVADAESTPPINPRVARWEVRFPPGATVENYGHELDAVGIELGAIGGGDSIEYASGFGQQQPLHRVGPGADEHRPYLVWQSGALVNMDATLLSRAGVSIAGKLVAHFLSPQLEKELAAEEQRFAAPRAAGEARRTVFALVPEGDSCKFQVAEQEYYSGEIKTAGPAPTGGKTRAGAAPAAAKLP